GPPVVDRAERDAVVVGLQQRVAERENLKAARVGEDRAVPAHEGVQAAQLGDQLLTGPEVKVVRVGEHDLSAERTQLVRVHGLDDLRVRLPLAVVAPEVPPLVRAPRPHRLWLTASMLLPSGSSTKAPT